MKALDKLKNLNPFKKPDVKKEVTKETALGPWVKVCLLYTSDAADE